MGTEIYGDALVALQDISEEFRFITLFELETRTTGECYSKEHELGDFSKISFFIDIKEIQNADSINIILQCYDPISNKWYNSYTILCGIPQSTTMVEGAYSILGDKTRLACEIVGESAEIKFSITAVAK